MDERVLLEASDRVRRNSLVLRFVAEAVEVPQDRLAGVEVAISLILERASAALESAASAGWVWGFPREWKESFRV